MAHIIDRRQQNSKGKSTDNRRRFIRRVKKQISDAVRDAVTTGSIEDVVDSAGKKVNIPGKGLDQPTFHHGTGGKNQQTHPGNKHFDKGDRVPRPESGEGGGGREGSEDGEGEDEFTFTLTREEFLDAFFEGLELPDLVKKNIATMDEYLYKRAGFQMDGSPARMNIGQSMKKAKGRRVALRSPKRKKLREKELEMKSVLAGVVNAPTPEEDELIQRLTAEISALKRKIKAVPFIDDIDLRFNRWEKTPVPTTKAVMFGIMDVSASMGEWEKEIAKSFFMLLYMFLHRQYEKVDIVWIRHHTAAAEVTEDEFFYSKETGGTVVSTSLNLMADIIDERYPTTQWNIFGCQVSDGDNWLSDNPVAIDMMQTRILPKVQYYAYVEVKNPQYVDLGTSDLWPQYESLTEKHQNLAMNKIYDKSEIYPTFRKLFTKKTASTSSHNT